MLTTDLAKLNEDLILVTSLLKTCIVKDQKLGGPSKCGKVAVKVARFHPETLALLRFTSSSKSTAKHNAEAEHR